MCLFYSYRPGDDVYKVGGMSRGGFAIPEVTTLLIVGPAGAGKSCLINNMIRVLDDVTSSFDRAQTYGLWIASTLSFSFFYVGKF